MTTQQKTDAIKKIAANHEDNRTAAQAAGLHPGLSALVVEAMNEALRADLAKVFAAESHLLQGCKPTSGQATAGIL